MAIKLSKVHPEILERAKQLVVDINWLALKEDNPAVGPVIDWVCSEHYENNNKNENRNGQHSTWKMHSTKYVFMHALVKTTGVCLLIINIS